jgi:hypothetical protein
MATSLHDRLTGHFLPRQAQAAEMAPEAADDVVDVVEDNFALPATPEAIGAELADVHRLLSSARARRQELLLAGDLVGLEVLDGEIRRLETAAESLETRRIAAYNAAIEGEQTRRAQEWARLRPELQRAQSTVSRLAFAIFGAVDELQRVEAAAAALGIAVGPTPAALFCNGWWLRERAREHVRATGAALPATAEAA